MTREEKFFNATYGRAPVYHPPRAMLTAYIEEINIKARIDTLRYPAKIHATDESVMWMKAGVDMPYASDNRDLPPGCVGKYLGIQIYYDKRLKPNQMAMMSADGEVLAIIETTGTDATEPA